MIVRSKLGPNRALELNRKFHTYLHDFGELQKFLQPPRINSSQHAIPPPRSLAQLHQPLRGVMITNGGNVRFVPWILPITLNASAGVRFALAMRVTSEPRRAMPVSEPASSLDTCRTGGPKGCRKLSALLGQRPGRPPRVTIMIARWRFWRRASPSGPVSVLLGVPSVSPIGALLPSRHS